MKHLSAITIAFGLLILSASGASAADNATCSASNPLPPGTYGNVDALTGCVLNESHIIEGSLVLDGPAEVIGTHIAGDVAVFGGEFIDNVHIGGSLYLLGSFSKLTNSYIGGDIWGQLASVGVEFHNNEVVGSVLLDADGQETVHVVDNVIGGDLTILGFLSGGFTIDRNHVGGHFRLADAAAWLLFTSTVNANHIGGRFEIRRTHSDGGAFEDGIPLPILVSENVIQGHAGLFQNSELQFLDNQIAGALVCSHNDEFVHSGNSAHTRFGECTD